jgi:hypothetical protein
MFSGNFNFDTGEWSWKEDKPVKRYTAVPQGFKMGGWPQKYQDGGDISVPDLRKVKIKKAPSWKKP